MKKVEAIIRKTKFEDVKEALNAVGIEFITFWQVRGVGTEKQARIYRGIKYDTSGIERMMVTYVCREQYLDQSINAILESAKTGDTGDGRVFVSEISDGYRIRTGDKGDKSVFGTSDN